MLSSQKNNATASYSTLKSAFPVGVSVFALACLIPPNASLPYSILTINEL